MFTDQVQLTPPEHLQWQAWADLQVQLQEARHWAALPDQRQAEALRQLAEVQVLHQELESSIIAVGLTIQDRVKS